MKTIVTGGSGFIGSHVVDALMSEGHEVVVFDLEPPHREDVAWVDGDVCHFPTLLRAARGAEVIFHLAACSDVNDVLRIPAQAVRINVLGTACVLDAARAVGARVIFESTDWVYQAEGDNPGTFYLETGHIYTSTKLAGEMLCRDYYQFYDVPFTILRVSTPYGPRMREGLMIPIFVRQALAGGPITVHGDGRQKRQLVYVEDVAWAHVLAVLDGRAVGKTYNVAGPRMVSVLAVAKAVRARVNPDVEIVHEDARAGDYGGKHISCAGLKRELGWLAWVDFGEGLEKTIAWIRRNADAGN